MAGPELLHGEPSIHTPFLSRKRAVTLLEYRDAKVIFDA